MLCEAHHGPALWQLLARIMSDYDGRKRQLARAVLPSAVGGIA